MEERKGDEGEGRKAASFGRIGRRGCAGIGD